MASSKGKPTDPKLREEKKEEVKALEKGGGAGSWSAWKATELSKRYEVRFRSFDDRRFISLMVTGRRWGLRERELLLSNHSLKGF